MTAFQYFCELVEAAPGYRIIRRACASEQDFASCERAIGSRLPASLREALLESDGFDLLDEHGSFLRLYSCGEIASSTLESQAFWRASSTSSPWGNFISIARSDHTESQYAVLPLPPSARESTLHEIWPEGPDSWLTDPPLAPSFGGWLRSIADAIMSGDHERVYDTMWLGSTNPDKSPPPPGD